MRHWVGLVACALFGCGPAVPPADGDGSGSASAETSAGPGGSATSPTATLGTTEDPSSATIGGLTASTGVVDDGTDDGWSGFDCGAAPPGQLPRCLGGPESVCDPQPTYVLASVLVDAGDAPEEPPVNPYVYTCTIERWQESGAAVSLSLACADGQHTLDIGTSTDLWFDPAGELVLSVIHGNETFGGEDQLVTLRRPDGELVLAGANTPWQPTDPSIPPDFFAPLAVTVLPDVCDLEPWQDVGFVGPCSRLQRQALRFSLDGQSVDVHDRGVGELAPYVVLVSAAEMHHDIQCSDVFEHWYGWVVAPPQLE